MVHFATRDERVDKPFWIGPELGLFVTLWRLRRSYGPFPVRTGPSRLGQVTMEAAYVRWFGADWPTGGESGFLLSMQWAVSVPAF
jgi:hypothetical protein